MNRIGIRKSGEKTNIIGLMNPKIRESRKIRSAVLCKALCFENLFLNSVLNFCLCFIVRRML